MATKTVKKAVKKAASKPKAKPKAAAKPKPKAAAKAKPKAAAKAKPKAAAKAKPATKTKPAATEFPFLYLQHGKLNTDDFGKVSGAYIAFKSPVPEDRRDEVMKGAPEPITGISNWGPTIVSCESDGDMFDVLVASQYGGEDEYEVTDEAAAAFAADVEAWARKVHKKFPILFFLGPANVLEPSPWGAYSEQALPEVMIPFLERYADEHLQEEDAPDEDSQFGSFNRTAMACILQMIPNGSPELNERAKQLEERFPL